MPRNFDEILVPIRPLKCHNEYNNYGDVKDKLMRPLKNGYVQMHKDK